MLYLAIDQHHKQLTICLRNEAGDVILRRQVGTEWAKVRNFLAQVRDMAVPEGGFAVIVEVCGFNEWLLKLLPEYGCAQTVLVQPAKREKHKTDRRDAYKLGELLWTNRQRLSSGSKLQNIRRVHMPSAEDAADRQLTQLRCKTVDQRTKVINRVHHILHKHNLSHSCPTKGIQTKAARAWLKTLELPKIDRFEMDQLLSQWKMYDEHLELQEAEIKERQSKNETAKIIATIPGASSYSSLAIACRLSDGIERFDRARSLANFFGITPGCRNSGDDKQRLGAITKVGSKLARRLLGQLVLHVLRKDRWMRNWYKAIKDRRGSKIARVAVMRRLATNIWSMVKHRTPYCVGGPEEVAKARRLVETFA